MVEPLRCTEELTRKSMRPASYFQPARVSHGLRTTPGERNRGADVTTVRRSRTRKVNPWRSTRAHLSRKTCTCMISEENSEDFGAPGQGVHARDPDSFLSGERFRAARSRQERGVFAAKRTLDDEHHSNIIPRGKKSESTAPLSSAFLHHALLMDSPFNQSSSIRRVK
jgi:hypothetical protein